MTINRKINVLCKQALAFGLNQTKKQFQNITLSEIKADGDEVESAAFRIEVSDNDGANKESIEVSISHGEIKSKKPSVKKGTVKSA
jgi:hypothetical protein